MDKLINMLEEMDMPSDKIDEIIMELKKLDLNTPKEVDKGPFGGSMYLQVEYEKETDPYKKASIAARIISFNLEN